VPNDIFCAIACVTTWTSEGNSHGEGIKMAVPFGQSSVERITPRACVHEFLWPNPPNRFGCAINTCGAIVVTGVPMYASAYLRLSLSLSLSLSPSHPDSLSCSLLVQFSPSIPCSSDIFLSLSNFSFRFSFPFAQRERERKWNENRYIGSESRGTGLLTKRRRQGEEIDQEDGEEIPVNRDLRRSPPVLQSENRFYN